MLPLQENSTSSDQRIVSVTQWRNPPTVHHLKGIYYQNRAGCERGYRNFFNEHSDRMSLAQAQKHLDWELSAYNAYQTFGVYPCSDFYFACSGSRTDREALFRDAVRQSMIRLIAEVNLPLQWVAAVNASWYSMVGTIVFSKVISDADDIWGWRVVKSCFPRSFFKRCEPAAGNVNHLEAVVAQAFFDCAAQAEDFASRIDRFIKIARQYNFELPDGYRAFRDLDDGAGNCVI